MDASLGNTDEEQVRENLQRLSVVSRGGREEEEEAAEISQEEANFGGAVFLTKEPSLRSDDLMVAASRADESSSTSPGIIFNTSMTAMERKRFDGLMPWEKLDAQSPEPDLHGLLDPEERIKTFVQAIPFNLEVIRPLGAGHNGMVFSARQKIMKDELSEDEEDSKGERAQKAHVERRVAVKVLSSQRPGYLARKLRESTALTFVPPHPNIVKLLSKPASSAGYEYFIMELCDQSLDDWIEEKALSIKAANTKTRRPTMAAADTVRVLHELCDAVVLLEKFGVTHRDIKPGNVLLTFDKKNSASFTVKLADFGVADMQVGGTPTQYENFIGATPQASSPTQIYTSEHDFHAVVATIFFAWLGEPDWEEEQKRKDLFTDLGFARAAAKLELDVVELLILKFFERGLPTDLKEKTDEMLTLDAAVRELRELGRVLGMELELVADKIGKIDPRLKHGGDLNDLKLNAYCSNAFDYVSGRRKAKDLKTAMEYLDYIDDLFDMFKDDVPATRRAGLNFQKALILLPKLQTAVSDYRSASNEIVGASSQLRSLHDLGGGVERALRDTRSALKEGLSRIPKERDDSWDGPGRSQFVNIEALAQLEEAKYYSVTKTWNKADAAVQVGLEKVEASLDSFLEEAGGDMLKDPKFEYPAFQHRRNKYLLQHELMKIDSMKNQGVIRNGLVEEAIECCRLGVGNIHSTKEPPPSDVLEMSRCYAEALCIGNCFEEARTLCKQLYRDFGDSAAYRVSTARVLALWITALTGLDKDEYSKELGYVCGVFTSMHHLCAQEMCRNIYFVPNARAFLSSDKAAALASGADPLLPVPLIPSDDSLIREKADKALEAVELAVAKSKS